MHFSLLEKIGASALLCAWLIFGANFLAGILVHVREHEPSMQVADGTAGAKPGPAAAQLAADLGTLLAAAMPPDGEKVFAKCKACHTVEKGGASKVGPNLWNIVGGPEAHIQGFPYSDALASRHDQKWTYEELDAFLASPKTHVPGTKMTFAGLSDARDRAAVIRYLAANTESPPPFPEPMAKTAAAPVSEPAAAGTEAEQTTAAVGEPDRAQMPAATSEAPSGGPAAPEADLKALLASANSAAGEKVFNKCKACHNVEKGGANQIGPNLWNIVGAPIAHHEGYSYSPALAGKSGGAWTYEELDTYLMSPKSFAPGTKMTFPGLSKPEDRANVIAFLRSRSDSPPPLP